MRKANIPRLDVRALGRHCLPAERVVRATAWGSDVSERSALMRWLCEWQNRGFAQQMPAPIERRPPGGGAMVRPGFRRGRGTWWGRTGGAAGSICRSG
jgi:hypothetical protein